MDARFDSEQTGPGRLLLVAAGSVAAGVHAGLAPEHFHEWAPLGASFAAAAVVSSVAVVAVALRPAGPWPTRVLAFVRAGLVTAYVLTRVVALPPLDPEQEELDKIGLLTVIAEAGGVLVAFRRPIGRSTGSRQLFATRQGGIR